MESSSNYEITHLLNQIDAQADIQLTDREHIESLLTRIRQTDTVRVFDFDGTMIHKGFNSFSPIDTSPKDTTGALLRMKAYMICIEESNTYTELEQVLHRKNIALPLATHQLTMHQDFQTFKDQQMHYRWEHTMQKAVEWNLPMYGFDTSDVVWREGAKALLTHLLDAHIQVLIISSGVGNLIRHIVQEAGYDLDHPCLHIKGNDFIVDTQGRAIAYDNDLITPFSKQHIDYHKYGIGEKTFAIQSGDSAGDAYMITEHFERSNICNIGFSNGNTKKEKDFTHLFDIIMTQKSSSFTSVADLFF